jgi:ribosomal protein S18 acetylase RimI-like enzyme
MFMSKTRFITTKSLDVNHLQTLLNADPVHPHIHIVDMPYRLASTWQDSDCEIGIWKNDEVILAWALFQPPWWNLDYAIHPSERGSILEGEVFAWGKDQIVGYAKRTGDKFYGSIEFFEDSPNAEQTISHLGTLGFEKFDWSTVRFEIDLRQDLPQPQLPEGFMIRPLRGVAEVEDYVRLHRVAFGSDKMTVDWRLRTLEHPAYRPEIDLVIVNPDGRLVGFCICWMWGDRSHIEPLGIHPEFQGQGLGRALELTAIQAVRDQGTRFMVVDHVSLNEKAIALSLKTGFRQTNNNALRYFIDTGSQ